MGGGGGGGGGGDVVVVFWCSPNTERKSTATFLRVGVVVEATAISVALISIFVPGVLGVLVGRLGWW